MPSILITGANRGLGLEFARQYLAAGWRVEACCRTPDAADGLHALAAAGDLRIHALDINDLDQAHGVAAALAPAGIDVFLSNAATVDRVGYGSGAYEGHDDPDIRNYDFRDWRRVMEANLYAPAQLTGAFLDNVLAGERKQMVYLASGLSSVSNTVDAGRYAYRTSKAALNMLIRGFRGWLEPLGVTVAAVSPGWTRTDMGGPNATNSAEESVTGVRRVIDGLSLDQTGEFWNFDGTKLPW